MFLKVLKEESNPYKGSEYAGFIDLKSDRDFTIRAGQSAMINLGVRINYEEMDSKLEKTFLNIEQFKKSHFLQLSLRSSLAKRGLIIPNGVGIIDIDYRDEIKLMVHFPVTRSYIANILTSKNRIDIKKGERIAQISIIEHKAWLLGVDSKKERIGGFGSTGSFEDTEIINPLPVRYNLASPIFQEVSH